MYIIGPVSCHSSWKDEYTKIFNKTPNTLVLSGGNPKHRKSKYYNVSGADLILSTYPTASNDNREAAMMLKQNRTLMVIDEAHYIKNPEGNWSNAILNISFNASRRIALTGTPMPQSYTDIYNIVDYISPMNPIITSKDRLLLDERYKLKDFVYIKDKLASILYPHYYRVTKKDLKLKDQDSRFIGVTMNKYEKEIHDEIRTEIINRSGKDYRVDVKYLNQLRKGRMIRLRQIYSNISLLNKTIKDSDEDLMSDMDNIKKLVKNYNKMELPGKMTTIFKIVNEYASQNKKILIWSNFIGTVEMLVNEIKNRGFNVKKIIGSTISDPNEEQSKEIDTREKIKNEFNDKDSDLQVLIANPAACAEAISLHKACNTAIYYDLSYNCAHYLQSLDRIHRVGGSESRKSFYYFLQYKDTLEHKIFEKVQQKAIRMLDIIDAEFSFGNPELYDESEVSYYDDISKKTN